MQLACVGRGAAAGQMYGCSLIALVLLGRRVHLKLRRACLSLNLTAVSRRPAAGICVPELCSPELVELLLQAHAAKSKQDLTARETYDKPRMEDVVVVTPNKALIGKTFAR